LFLYDLLGLSSTIGRSKTLTFTHDINNINPLKNSLQKAIIYSDCTVDDARLVIANALQAKANNAIILTKTNCIQAKQNNNLWQITLQDTLTQTITHIQCKALVNASGPWVNQTIQQTLEMPKTNSVHLIKGSHILVPKLYDHQHAYVLQHTDGRVVFVIPYLKHFTLIGTTDINYDGDPLNAKITNQEIDYLCNIITEYFKTPLCAEQIVYTWSGVRPLIDEGSTHPSAINRGYKLELINTDRSKAPLLNIFGGKLTTYRQLSEKAVNLLIPFFPNNKKIKKRWTSNAVLPGGDVINNSFSDFYEQFTTTFPWLPEDLRLRYAQSYGTRIYLLLNNAACINDLGQYFGQGLYQKEVDYLIQQEWAITSEDILWRRTKLGLFLTDIEKKFFAKWMSEQTIKTRHAAGFDCC
jgi:glycerol-3-phosphate dehydrogenase